MDANKRTTSLPPDLKISKTPLLSPSIEGAQNGNGTTKFPFQPQLERQKSADDIIVDNKNDTDEPESPVRALSHPLPYRFRHRHAILFRDNETDLPPWYTHLKTWRFWSLGIYGLILILCSNMPSIVLPILGAKFFGENDDNDDDCDNTSNAKYAYYNGLSLCLSGIIGFITSGLIGRLADSYGRKKLMIFVWFCNNISVIIMGFSTNFWYYFSLLPLTGFSGAFGGFPTVFQASIADLIPQQQRSAIFAFCYGCAGIVLILSTLLGQFIVNYFGDWFLLKVNGVISVIGLLWLLVFVPETLKLSSRKKMRTKNLNPFRPLYDLRSNLLIFWICAISFVTNLPETGIRDMVISYLLDILNLCGGHDAYIFNTIVTLLLGISLLLTLFIIFPLLSNRFSDLFILIFGLIDLCFFFGVGIIIYILPEKFIAYIGTILFGISYILPPVTSGMLSSYLLPSEIGVGLGTLHSVKGITSAFGPLIFSQLYESFNNSGFLKTLPFWFGIIVILIGFPIVFIPLPKEISKRKKLKKMNKNKINENNETTDNHENNTNDINTNNENDDNQVQPIIHRAKSENEIDLFDRDTFE